MMRVDVHFNDYFIGVLDHSATTTGLDNQLIPQTKLFGTQQNYKSRVESSVYQIQKIQFLVLFGTKIKSC